MSNISVTSLSGGKTSSYMAIHYPTDYNVFALVTIDSPECAPKDSGLVKWVSDKIGKEFIATAEDDKTLVAVRDLEQLMGREIVWVTGISFDALIHKRKAVPNKMWRFCTTEMKMRPIFHWWYDKKIPPVDMHIGFRYDEKERANSVTNSFKAVTGKRGTKNKWETLEWRTPKFPLIDARVGHYTVSEWAKKSGLIFPPDSNCVGCFWKPVQQLRKNFDDNPEKMEWFSSKEAKGKQWQTDMSYAQIKKVGLQQDFFFGTGSGCQAGYCTD
jgi:hypothetical protein